MNTSSRTARGRSTAVKSQIDENLKRVYEHALNEEVPDRFKLLLDQLKRGTAEPSPEGAAPQTSLTASDRTASETAE